jgi:predicted phosphodiesterase
MATPVRSWKRGIAVGCSHGIHADPLALKAVVRVVDEWKPSARIHLGDWTDTTALRSGAGGTADEAEPLQPDIDGGLAFLDAMRATHMVCGNHEDRIWRAAASPRAIVAHCAQSIIQQIEAKARTLRAKLYTYDGVFQTKLKIGNYTGTHGTAYNENAARDHAEMHGNVFHAHTHRPAIATGRRSDHPTGICVGTLTRRREMDYAKTRRSTLAWGQAILLFHYCDDFLVPTLCLGPSEGCGDGWMLPV